jgi:hypothetical protein
MSVTPRKVKQREMIEDGGDKAQTPWQDFSSGLALGASKPVGVRHQSRKGSQ